MSRKEPKALDALVIVFTREFSPKDQFINSILTKLGWDPEHPYEHYMTDETPLVVRTHPKAQEFDIYMAIATTEFRRLVGGHFDLECVTASNFAGSHGISGIVLAHWKMY